MKIRRRRRIKPSDPLKRPYVAPLVLVVNVHDERFLYVRVIEVTLSSKVDLLVFFLISNFRTSNACGMKIGSILLIWHGHVYRKTNSLD